MSEDSANPDNLPGGIFSTKKHVFDKPSFDTADIFCSSLRFNYVPVWNFEDLGGDQRGDAQPDVDHLLRMRLWTTPEQRPTGFFLNKRSFTIFCSVQWCWGFDMWHLWVWRSTLWREVCWWWSWWFGWKGGWGADINFAAWSPDKVPVLWRRQGPGWRSMSPTRQEYEKLTNRVWTCCNLF